MANPNKIKRQLIASAEADPSVDIQSVRVGKSSIKFTGIYDNPLDNITGLRISGSIKTSRNHKIANNVQYTYANESGYATIVIETNGLKRSDSSGLLGSVFGASDPQQLVTNLDALPAVKDAYIYGTINGSNFWYT